MNKWLLQTSFSPLSQLPTCPPAPITPKSPLRTTFRIISSLSLDLCICQLAHHWDTMSDIHNFKEGRFNLSLFQVIQSMGGWHEGQNRWQGAAEQRCLVCGIQETGRTQYQRKGQGTRQRPKATSPWLTQTLTSVLHQLPGWILQSIKLTLCPNHHN